MFRLEHKLKLSRLIASLSNGRIMFFHVNSTTEKINNFLKIDNIYVCDFILPWEYFHKLTMWQLKKYKKLPIQLHTKEMVFLDYQSIRTLLAVILFYKCII